MLHTIVYAYLDQLGLRVPEVKLDLVDSGLVLERVRSQVTQPATDVR